MQEVVQKLNHFSVFKEGCDTEIEYYKDIYEEFNQKIKLGIKYQELENYITSDLLGITSRVNKIDETFKKFDQKLNLKQSEMLNKKLAEYQSKFEKLVDVVLKEQKPSDAQKVSANTTPLTSGRLSFMKRSASVNFDLIADSQPNKFVSSNDITLVNKVKQWYDIKTIDNQTLNFSKALEESKPKNLEKYQKIANERKQTIAEAADDKSIVDSINKLR